MITKFPTGEYCTPLGRLNITADTIAFRRGKETVVFLFKNDQFDHFEVDSGQVSGSSDSKALVLCSHLTPMYRGTVYKMQMGGFTCIVCPECVEIRGSMLTQAAITFCDPLIWNSIEPELHVVELDTK